MALRKCRDCGLEGHNKGDLEGFRKNKTSKHGRMNLCKQCANERLRQYRVNRMDDDRYRIGIRLNAMKQRCYDPKQTNYSSYGGRGITVCQEWFDDTDAFVNWALANGFKRGLEIDRIDNDGSYSPENCRWVTHSQQMRNTRVNVTNFEKGTRICSRCGEEKPLEEFHRDRDQPTGRGYLCKPCLKTYQREWMRKRRSDPEYRERENAQRRERRRRIRSKSRCNDPGSPKN